MVSHHFLVIAVALYEQHRLYSRMGYGLYFENMFASVIIARDRYLKADGLMMPSQAQLFIQAMDPDTATATATAIAASLTSKDKYDDTIGWWKDVYGFDMSEMMPIVAAEAQVQMVKPQHIISNRSLFHQLDLQTATDSDLNFTTSFHLVS
jgi:hypothetical protein